MDTLVIDGKYQVVRELGRGGMGAVYEARHLGTGRRVAVKLILGEALQNSSAIARFLREAKATGAIESQHIAVVLDTGTEQATRRPYLVMEFLSGNDVEHLIHRGAVAPDVALRIIAQACMGLEAAHAAGVVHRDIKPGNLFLARRDGGEVVVKLLDFGIAKVTMADLTGEGSSKLTRTGSMLGSPLYMSPEQAIGKKTIDHRTDLWSLGIVLYELLTGSTPHGDADTLGALILAICSQPARRVTEISPSIPVEVAAVVHRAIEIDPEKRFSSAAEMLAAVRALLPRGTALHESMLAAPGRAVDDLFGVSLDRAGAVAAVSAVSGSVPPPSVQVSPPGGLGGSATSDRFALSATSTTHSQESPPAAPTATSVRRSRAVPIAAAVAVLGGGLALAGYRIAAHAPVEAATTAEGPRPSAAAVATESPVVTPSGAPGGALRSVQVEILPHNATVDVDGVPANAVNGVVLISGSLGSMHKVHVVVGKRESTTDVVVSEAGAVPAKVELGAPGAAPKPAGPTPSAARAAPPATGPTPVSAPADPPPQPRKQPTSKPPVDREFK